jgi:branched-chain amino acid transport system substrate-binding protein
MAAYDEEPVNAARMAIEEINAKGGLLSRQITLVHADAKTDRAEGAKAGAQVIEQGAQMVIVGCDFDMGAPPALVANQHKIISFSTCGADIKFGNLSAGKYVFTMASDSAATGAIMADWAFRHRGWKTAYTLLDTIIEYDKSLCRGFKERWTELAGKESLLLEDTFKNEDPSVASQITRFKALPKQPEVMMLCSVTPGGAAAMRQFRAAGVDVPIMAGTWADGDAWHDSLPAEDLDEIYYNSYSSARGDDPRPDVKDFVKAFEQKYGNRPATGQAVTGYSVVQAWARAVERAGTLDSDAVVAELEKFKDEPLLAGLTTFTPELHTNVNRPMIIIGFHSGKPKPEGYYDPRKGQMVEWWTQ